MERLTHWRVSGIKTGHWPPAKKEELIQKLAAYEDTGLAPNEIRDLAKWLQKGPVDKRESPAPECMNGLLSSR